MVAERAQHIERRGGLVVVEGGHDQGDNRRPYRGALLLAAQARDRGLDRALVALDTGEHPAVELVGRAAGREGRFTVERTGDQELRAAAEVAGEARIERVADLGDRSTASMLGRALTAIGRDEVYEHALASALDFRR